MSESDARAAFKVDPCNERVDRASGLFPDSRQCRRGYYVPQRSRSDRDQLLVAQ